MSNIISLSVENFRSYKEKYEISFEAINENVLTDNYHNVDLQNGDTIRLLNSAVIYGANASGKSSIVTAFLALVTYVNNSDSYKPKRKLTYEPFIFSSETKNAPVKIGVEFIVEGEVYCYNISYNNVSFVSERLFKKYSNDTLIERNQDGLTVVSNDLGLDFEQISYPLNHLALSELVTKAKESDLLFKIYEVISNIETIQTSNRYATNYNIQEAAKIIHENPDEEFGKLINTLIKEADTGITNVDIKELGEKDYSFPSSASDSFKSLIMDSHPYEIKMAHLTKEGDSRSIPIEYESEGTQTLFMAGTRVIKALQEGSVLIYDEMNIALHPLLFRRLVSLFNDEKTNPNNAQLLITTHDTILIDEPGLRADQVWFAEKDSNGESELFSAVDFDGLEIDEPFGPWYRSGRLGARPNLKFFDTFTIKD
ncbi:MAG: ATP-binding protein [Prevotellaceae bacterium]|nr:ATP-binding protein [Candidatus Faecinaster equi]